MAITAGIDFGAALFINFLFSLWFNFSVTTHWHTIVIYAAVLLLHGLMNQFGIRLVALLNNVSVWWHIVGVLIIVGAMIFGLKAGAHHASAKFVFTGLENLSGFHIGWWYILPIGLLMAQYTFTGYDASAHMTEETHNAARSGPRGIVMSILISLIAGWVLLIGITFAIQKSNYAARRRRSWPRARSGSTRSAGPAPNCCCWWRSAPSCSAACRRSPRTRG